MHGRWTMLKCTKCVRNISISTHCTQRNVTKVSLKNSSPLIHWWHAVQDPDFDCHILVLYLTIWIVWYQNVTPDCRSRISYLWMCYRCFLTKCQRISRAEQSSPAGCKAIVEIRSPIRHQRQHQWRGRRHSIPSLFETFVSIPCWNCTSEERN